MIRMVGKGEKLAEEDVAGRYVVKRDARPFAASPGFVRVATHMSSSRVYVEKERGVWNDEKKMWLLTGEGTREPDGYFAASSIACICDTPEEVNYLLELGRALEKEQAELVDAQHARVAALHGMELGGGRSGPAMP